MKRTIDDQIMGVIDTTTQEKLIHLIQVCLERFIDGLNAKVDHMSKVLEKNPETELDRENVVTDLKLTSIIVSLVETKEEAFSKITSMTLWKNLERR